MSVLKTYTISDINHLRLEQEIIDSNSVNNFQGISHYNNKVDVIADSFINETDLDNVFNNHELETLEEYKDAKNKSIDAKTYSVIGQGFTYAGKQFSLSEYAQINLITIELDKNILLYPIIWNTIDDKDTYDIQDATDVTNFHLTALNVIKSTRDSGTNLKKLVNASTTKAEVDLIIDNR